MKRTKDDRIGDAFRALGGGGYMYIEFDVGITEAITDILYLAVYKELDIGKILDDARKQVESERDMI